MTPPLRPKTIGGATSNPFAKIESTGPPSPVIRTSSSQKPANSAPPSDEKRQRMRTDWPAYAERSWPQSRNTGVALPLFGFAGLLAVETPLNAPCDGGKLQPLPWVCEKSLG